MNGSYVLATISLDRMAGGLERNIVRLANRLAQNGHSVGLVTFDWESAQSFYPIDDEVRWYKVATSQPHAPIGFRDRLHLILKIREALKDSQASVVVCFHHGILARFLLAALFLNVRMVVSERNALSIYDHIRQSKWNLNFLLMFLVDGITVQFPQYVNDYPSLLRSRIAVIPNPVMPVTPLTLAHNDNRHRRHELLAVGRLCAQKNYEALIDAFASLASRFPDWDLIIVGDGESRGRLLQRIAEHELETRVRLVAATPSVFDAYENASLFCMPSKWEGFPNALAEAMAHGLPAIGYQDCAGVSDVIAHGRNGLLAEGNGNVASLAKSLDCLMADPKQREKMGNAARDSVQQFKLDAVFPLWEELLVDVTNPR